jgi:hypothetical protein
MSKGGRRALTVVGIVVGVGLLIRVFLDPVATWVIRRQLKDAPGMQGVIAGAHVSLLPPGLSIDRLKLIEVPGGSWEEPLFYAEQLEGVLLWRALLRGELVMNARIENPKVVLYQAAKAKAGKTPDLTTALEAQAPFKVARVEVVNGELTFASGKGKDIPTLWLHDFEIVAQNLASRKELSEGRPATLMARGRLQRTATVDVFVTLDPWKKGLNFSGRASMRGLGGSDINALLAAKGDMVLKEGTVDVFSEFDVRQSVISGGVKPVLNNIEVRSADDGVWSRLKAWAVDGSLDILSDDVPGRDAVATVVPLKGRVDALQTQLTPTLIGVIRNAFVVGLQSGFAHLPPPQSDKKESIVKQLKDGLDRKQGPPEAQPGKVQ